MMSVLRLGGALVLLLLRDLFGNVLALCRVFFWLHFLFFSLFVFFGLYSLWTRSRLASQDAIVMVYDGE